MKMKLKTLTLMAALMVPMVMTAQTPWPTKNAEKTTLVGTEFTIINDGSADKKALISTIWKAPALTGGLTATGSTAWDFSGSTAAFKTSTGVNTFGGSSHTFASGITPVTNDVGALGSGSLGWADLFLATGGTIKFASTDWVATHSTGILTVGTGDLRVTTAGTNAASVVTVGGTQTLTNKTLTSPTMTAPVLGVATATSVNGLTISTSTGTLTIPNGVVLTGPASTGTTATLAGTETLTNKTLTAPVINGATSASGNFDLSGSTGTTKTTTGLTTIGGGLVGSIQALSGAGAVNLTTTTTAWTTTGADAGTLANGTNGQVKVVVMVVDGGTGTLTPTTASGFTAITFDDPGDAVTLQYHTAIGWVVIGFRGVTF